MRITVARMGTKFSAFQIERLYAECRAWIDFDEFHVFTDQAQPYHKAITVHRVTANDTNRRWWVKLLQFREFTQGATVSLDVDMHIRDSVQFDFNNNKLLMQKDPLAQYHPHKNIEYVNSSFITYTGDCSWIYNKYMSDWKKYQQKYRGDQEFLWGECRENIAYHKPMFESYKWESRQRGYALKPMVAYHGEDVKEICG